MLSFFPRDVLDETLNLTESVSEGFSTYSFIIHIGFVFILSRSAELFGKKDQPVKVAILGDSVSIDGYIYIPLTRFQCKKNIKKQEGHEALNPSPK